MASIASFPFQVGLFIGAPVSGGVFGAPPRIAFCGGVIIDSTQVVTAAHCVTNELTGAGVDPATVTALTGSATLPPSPPAAPVATRIAVDPHYSPRTADYDVAVVTLASPLFSGAPRADGAVAVAPIALATRALVARFADPNVSPPLPVVISGWGQTVAIPVGAHDPTANLPAQLQAAQTHLVSDAACIGQYGTLASIGVPTITPRMLCAGEPGGGTDACLGDSGGPLVVDLDTPARPPGDYVLVGLIDFGAGCAQAGYPGVYVRLSTPEIASFIGQEAQAQGQQLLAPPTPSRTSPPRRGVGGTATLAARRAVVRHRAARVAVRCVTAACRGTLTLRASTTIGIAHFALAADSTARVRVPITRRGQRELDRHQHRLVTRATLRASGARPQRRTLILTD